MRGAPRAYVEFTNVDWMLFGTLNISETGLLHTLRMYAATHPGGIPVERDAIWRKCRVFLGIDRREKFNRTWDGVKIFFRDCGGYLEYVNDVNLEPSR
jgi:hypothetical protein